MIREQEQFLDVVDRDEAERRWVNAIFPYQSEIETVLVRDALGRVLAEDIISDVDVPGFDRSNMDGYAVISKETYHASEDSPRFLKIRHDEIRPGRSPDQELLPGFAVAIATGGMIPRGADAVMMVEQTLLLGDQLKLTRPVAPGAHISYAGTDIARGETTILSGTRLTARETGLLAAIGRLHVPVIRRPRVAIISTGDEIISPGTPYTEAMVYDANARLIADSVREAGGIAIELGIIRDEFELLQTALQQALKQADLVILSGGTSKGGGDLSYRALAVMQPGILVHGVALKPGKPICLGASGRKPVVILPGFPTSAIFTFHEFVAPVIRRMAGIAEEAKNEIAAEMASRVNSERGRTEYLLVGLMPNGTGYSAYPMGKGSGSVTTFSRADGFVVIPKHQEYLEKMERVNVIPLSREMQPADLVVIGSHCIGLDYLLSELSRLGVRSKSLWVGSQGGIDAASRGECDIAGTHLLDPVTDQYNVASLNQNLTMLHGYGRMQGFVYRPTDDRFDELSAEMAIEKAIGTTNCRMVSRNRGSGTRVIIDKMLKNRKPPGCNVEVRSHHAVATSVMQSRADWGVTIEPVARLYGLKFFPLRLEHYDFVVPNDRKHSTVMVEFQQLLATESIQMKLQAMGFFIRPETAQWAY